MSQMKRTDEATFGDFIGHIFCWNAYQMLTFFNPNLFNHLESSK